ncbi:SMI1/KNR4 family protein [Hymenobacter ruricola]|uniref:SMI1/KNR4 family protein n=1 Tax=Hymenobacter ruricola TaxID=2791023 RepID=A0ABS0I168_9BACT|nr:SMI1/KNR4 family protein [Hymenobacter ruricola]MBF9220483.1 SMI1/KNR4 family protein [Hymenobacter ruricola]
MIPQHQQEFLDTLDFAPPEAYRSYLFSAESNYEFGGAYLIEADELLQFNTDYQAAENYPGYFLIGSDGGGEAFAIEKATGNFVQTPFIGHDEETSNVVGRTWSEFLEFLQAEYA